MGKTERKKERKMRGRECKIVSYLKLSQNNVAHFNFNRQ